MFNSCKLRFTYTKVSPESSEDGDIEDAGWYEPGGWYFSTHGDKAIHKENMENPPAFYECTAKECISQIEKIVGSSDSISVRENELSIYGSDSEIDFKTGIETTFCAHVEADPRLIKILAQYLEHDYK